MRVAIHNPFKRKCVAETELSRRIYLAANAIGWDAAEVGCADEIKPFAPDFVISLHHQAAKLTAYPTYGCMWNPPEFFEKEEKYVKNILSYDGYLVSSGTIHRWLHHLLYTTPKRYLMAPFYTSCHRVPYHAPLLDDPRLVYFGVNWDGSRFQQLFAGLDAQDYMEIYGEPSGWQYLQQSYRGTLPCDGVSVLETLNRAGIGLCLHKEQHRQTGIPSMRIFEIVASGAIAICSEHSFIKETFGDSVLYIDADLSVAELVQQISQRVEWVRHHPQAALALSQTAHAIYWQNYSLEQLLQGIAAQHEALVREKGFYPVAAGAKEPHHADVQIIVRANDNEQALQRTLDSIVAQTHSPVSVMISGARVDSSLVAQLKPYDRTLAIDVLESEPSGYRSRELWQALKAVQSDYFSILHSGEVLFPNHLHWLSQLLHQFPDAGVAYSGAIHRVMVDESKAKSIREPVRLNQFQCFEWSDLLSLNSLIASNSFVARSALIQQLNPHDPQLALTDELYLLLYFAAIAKFVFSYEVTCECQHKPYQNEAQKHIWENEISDLKTMLKRQDIAPGKQTQLAYHAQVDYLDLQTDVKRLRVEMKRSQLQLQAAQEAIAAMESSKFWQLRTQWFKLKQKMGINQDS
ncbi:hypothetical protein IQ268_06785 [Oculatella sp. LEGE 06141]|uniref:glycosyltransferase family protein n=1 Tax=Oculatella sp. LEGE 06141 TaxID=1828648 RepID=UPI0018825345|nr:glycosyltransferase [Oculatella sp. LEGE 06141]MBE9178291.1 hypothetical protein [Oculatella sp. LEGE 06141]